MQLTQHTDYAIRTLLYALAHNQRLVTITEIATFYQISRSHLAKVVASLTQAGYLQGVRGKKGGLKLAHAPEDINIGALVQQFEPLELAECFGSKNTCLLSNQCKLKRALVKAKKAFLDVLKQYSLADLQVDPTKLPADIAVLHFHPPT